MRRSLSLLLAVAVTACSSGSSGPTAAVPPTTLSIASADSNDGRLVGTGSGGVLVVCCGLNAAMYVGQASASFSLLNFVPGISRGYVRFLLDQIPAGRTIVSATLRLQQTQPSMLGSGVDPYPTMGNVVIDHVDFGTKIDSTDFNSAAIAPSAAVLSTNFLKELKSVDVTALVRADYQAGRGHSDFRLRFASEPLPASQNAVTGTYFSETTTGVLVAGPAPTLVVTYQ